ncbi:MAG: AMP-binding protein [Chloroflexota bacterium]|nr:MAG: AMP-binding protein [Chloroflexota bacterium]
MNYAEKPWLKSYKLGPYKLEQSLAPYPLEPVYKILDQGAENHPGQTAIFYLGRSINYSQLKRRVDKLAGALARLGVEKGDRVCVYLPNCPEFIISDWAIQKAGAAIVPTSILRTAEGLLHEASSSNSKVIICQERNLDLVLGVKDQCDLAEVIVTSNNGYDLEAVSGSLPKHGHDFRELINETDPIPPQVEIDPQEDLCELSFTGGATGTPKGVMITHANRLSCIHQSLPWVLKPLIHGFAGKASVLIAIPLFHSYGHFTQQSSALLGLRILLLPDPRDSNLMIEYIEKYRPLFIPAVPTQLMRIADAELSRMNSLLWSGAAPLPIEVGQAIKRKIGMPVSQAYGLTETSPVTHFNVSSFSKITGFMAKEKFGIGIPTPDTECRLIDIDTGEDVPAGKPGEIVVRGPQVMKGYWPKPGSGLTPDGWLHTGDIGTMDEDGYFQVVDRTKDMVNVSGLKVYTNTVDEVLYEHPGVLMAAAFGVPDPENPSSERVMAVIQPKKDYRGTISEAEIRAFCQERLSPYAVPKFIEFRDDMPLTVTEKVYKKALREEVLRRMEKDLTR